MDFSKTIDEIYEASLVPDLWIRALDRLAALAGGEGALLFTNDADGVRWICSSAIVGVVQEWVSSGWSERDPRGKRLIPIQDPRFLTDLDGFTPEELEREPFYTEFLRPRGLGWSAGTAIRTPTGDIVFSVERAYRRGPVGRPALELLDSLRPHLARATMFSTKLGLGRAQATVDALQTIGLPAAVLRQSGRAVAANEDFLKCAPAIKVGANDQISFANSGIQKIFVDSLANAGQRSVAKAGRSIAVPGGGKAAAQVAHLLPLRGAGRDIFSGASSLLFVTRLMPQKAPDVRLLEVLFDLTPAEARVASLLVEGKSVEAIAGIQKVERNTIRMHLKSVFTKTGVHRQAELVSLLAQRQ